MEAVLQLVQRINFYLSDYILVFLLIGTGLYFSVRTRFVQVRCFGEGMRAVFGEFSMRGGRQKGGLSSFQALTTAIAAQVGTGNIIGACGAILLGGPGAIFWMWIIAFFGMATIYAEATLAPPLTKEQAHFGFDAPARRLHDLIRGLNPWPVAYFEYGGKKVKVLRTLCDDAAAGAPGEILSTKPLKVACASGALTLLEVVPEGSRPMEGSAWAAGRRFTNGDKLQ